MFNFCSTLDLKIIRQFFVNRHAACECCLTETAEKIFLIKLDVDITPLGHHPNSTHFNFSQSVIITLWIFEFVRH
jgi:hypothetical protein